MGSKGSRGRRYPAAGTYRMSAGLESSLHFRLGHIKLALSPSLRLWSAYVLSMKQFPIFAQPDEVSCGAACLHAVLRHYDINLPLEQLAGEITQLASGGTLAVYLGLDALHRGLQASIYTCDLNLFDPTWFRNGAVPVLDRLRLQAAERVEERAQLGSLAYIEYLEGGGLVFMEDISFELLQRLLSDGGPLIAGLSSTWLYRQARELPDGTDDDIRGLSSGHFVVIHSVDSVRHTAAIADPYAQNPFGTHWYEVPVARLITAIMLGVVTYDAKLLVIRRSIERSA